MNASISHRLVEQGPCKLSSAGHYCSPGCCAKYLTNSLMTQETNDIIAFSVARVKEAGSSNPMEKLEFQKTLNEVKEKGIVVKQLTTDRHI